MKNAGLGDVPARRGEEEMRGRKIQEWIGSFEAVSASGNPLTINIYQDYIIETLHHGVEVKLPGKLELRTDDGTFVNPDKDDPDVFYVQGLLRVTRVR